jgi:hypothetical protein
VNFTGSTRVGRLIAMTCAKYLKPAVLELGGKAPLLVLDDADLDDAVNGAAFGCFANSGQICMSTERLIVDEKVAEAFVRKLATKAKSLPLGDPRKPEPVVLGSVIGTLIGVLPGIGPLAALALLLPITFTLPPIAGMLMLSAIFYGAMYGGSTTSILLNMPGEPSAVLTTLDGHPLAKQGRGSAALAISGIGSFVGATLSVIAMTFLSAPLAKLAVAFSPAASGPSPPSRPSRVRLCAPVCVGVRKVVTAGVEVESATVV